MNYGLLGPLMAQIDFGTVVLAILGIFSMLVVVEVLKKGIVLLKNSIAGGRIEYGGKFWDSDVYDSAMNNLETFKKSGGVLDKESRAALKDWKNNKARSGLF